MSNENNANNENDKNKEEKKEDDDDKKLEIRYDAGIGKQVKLMIKKFNLNQMAKNCAIVIVAKRGSGKSFLTRALLHYFSDIPVGVIISGTEDVDPYYSLFFPDCCIFKEYRQDLIRRILERQEAIKEKLEKHPNIDPRAFIIMDDCLAQRSSWAKDPYLNELMMNGRHYNITYILTMQYPLGVPPEIRGNFDYRFLLADDQPGNIEKIFKQYAGIFPNYATFKTIFSQVIPDYRCMVISNRGANQEFSEKVFWYKAPGDGTDDKVGCNQLWKYHELNYNTEWRKKRIKNDKNKVEKVKTR